MQISEYNNYLESEDSKGKTYLIYNSISNGLGTVNENLYRALKQKMLNTCKPVRNLNL